MKRPLTLIWALGLVAWGTPAANAVTLIGGSINNGWMDSTHAEQAAPGFFLPKPNVWIYEGSRTISGPYADGLDSEPWAGPAPTPVTNGNLANAPFPDGCGNVITDGDCGVFYKPFAGNATDGALNVTLYQDNPATPGLTYTLTGWAGAEANFLGTGEFDIEFLDGSNTVIGGTSLDLNAAGLFVPNGQPFNYKSYQLSAVAPPGSAVVRVSSRLLDGMSNPAGGGQAYVVDDFSLVAVPEPASIALVALGVGWLGLARRRQ